MSNSREKIITVRVNTDMYNEAKKRAATAGLALSEYVCQLMADAFSNNNRLDLLIRNVHEEVLQLEDMMTLMQGYNAEVFATLLARTSKTLSEEQKNELRENRRKAVEGLQGYMVRASDKIISGENVWGKEQKEQAASSTE